MRMYSNIQHVVIGIREYEYTHADAVLTTPALRLRAETDRDWRVGERAAGARQQAGQQREAENQPTSQPERMHFDRMLLLAKGVLTA